MRLIIQRRDDVDESENFTYKVVQKQWWGSRYLGYVYAKTHEEAVEKARFLVPFEVKVEVNVRVKP